MIRLQKILSAAGVASRRTAETLITQGRVRVNGKVVTELGTKADPATDEIKVDERRLPKPKHTHYILLNKPRGYITSRSDPKHRPTVLISFRSMSVDSTPPLLETPRISAISGAVIGCL